jgi:molybdopterin molybdotransferase
VRRRPRVAILATGDELVPVYGVAGPGQILDSNSHALAAACAEAGGEPVLLPLAGDRREAIRAALEAARGCDAVVTSGGVSVGDRDLTRSVIASMGTKLAFWRVAMKPGKPVAFGRWGGAAVFGLPGNPASALVTFELFVRPALRALGGATAPSRAVLPARLATSMRKEPGLTYFVRAHARLEGGALWVEPLRTQSSGALTSATGFEALAVLPPAPAVLRRGVTVEAILVAPPRRGSHRQERAPHQEG